MDAYLSPGVLTTTDLALQVMRFMGQTLAEPSYQACMPLQAQRVNTLGQSSLLMDLECLLLRIPGLGAVQRSDILRSHWQGLPVGRPTQWWYCSHNADLLVTHNCRRVKPGKAIELKRGDVLELGWLVLQVVSAQALLVQQRETPPSPSSQLPVQSAGADLKPPHIGAALMHLPLSAQPTTPVATPTPKVFELTDLAPPPERHTSGFNPFEIEQGEQNSDIGELLNDALQPDSATAAIAPIHGHAAAADADAPDLADALTIAKPLNNAQVSSLVVQPIWLQEQAPPQQGQVDAQDPLQPLHEQYLAHLHNPFHSSDVDVWGSLSQGQQKAGADPLEELKQAAGQGLSLLDLMGAQPNMAQIINGFDSLSRQDLLAPEPRTRIVQLFAPPAAQTQAGADALIAPAAPPGEQSIHEHAQPLPRLTLREHHNTSLDSAMSAPSAPLAHQPSSRQEPSVSDLFGLHDAELPKF